MSNPILQGQRHFTEIVDDEQFMLSVLAAGISLVLVGTTGIGKTQMPIRLAENLSKWRGKHYECITINPSNYHSVVFGGYAVPDLDQDEPQTVQTVPWIIMEMRKAGPNGIFFIDELDKGDDGMQRVCAEIFEKRSVNGHHIPKGWLLMGARNRLEDKTGGMKIFSHLNSRICNVYCEYSSPHFLRWARQQEHIPALALAFAEFKPDLISQTPRDDGQSYGTPRMFEKFCKFLHLRYREQDNIGFDITDDGIIANGCMGQAFAVAFSAFMQHANDLPSVGEVFQDPEGAKLPSDGGAQYAMVGMLLGNSKGVESIRASLRYLKRDGFPKNLLLSYVNAITTRYTVVACQVDEVGEIQQQHLNYIKRLNA